MRTAVSLLLLFASLHLPAQNLVINPGFEEKCKTEVKDNALKIIDDVKPPGWNMPTDGTSDYYHFTDEYITANKEYESVHDSPLPAAGNCCGGFARYNNLFEYLQGTFTAPLVKDSHYVVSVMIATGRNEQYHDSRLGIHFSKLYSPTWKGRGCFLAPWPPHIRFDQAVSKVTKGLWTTYTFDYVAKGGERTFIIGDFEKKNRKREATYFFIDQMYVGSRPPTADDFITVAADTNAVPADSARIAAGSTLVLTSVYFETNQSRLLPESFPSLDSVIAVLKQQPGLKVEIIGHTDKQGNAADNQTLSGQRALAVKEYFISQGIEGERITTAGKGSSQPISDDDSRNRRVEFRFYE